MLSETTIKHLNKLKQKKYRRDFAEFFVEGIKGVSEALESEFEVILLLVDGKKRDEEKILEVINIANKKSVQVEYLNYRDIKNLKSTETFPGIMAVVVQRENYLEDIIKSGETVICLDKVKDPGNVGTIIRTADWFGIKNIIFSEDSVDPYNEKLVRSTMGSIFHVNIFMSKNIVQTLEKIKTGGYSIYSLDMGGDDVSEVKKNDSKSVYIFGSESQGVENKLEKIIDKSYTIVGSGQAESLNVAVAGAILLNSLKK